VNELFSIEGKRVLVTGGARGVGGGTARYLATQGAQIVTFDIRDELGSQLAKEATEAGPGRITYRHVDILNPDEITAGVEWAVGELGGLDAMITSHGGPLLSAADETPLADWDWMLTVNSRGTGLLCQAVKLYVRGFAMCEPWLPCRFQPEGRQARSRGSSCS